MAKKINKKKEVNGPQFIRAVFILAFAGNMASAIMYNMLISNPDVGMQVLAAVNTLTAGYFLYKAIQ